MKLLFLSTLILFPFSAFADILFQPHLDHEQAHELVWVFPKAPKDWGKTDKEQVALKCLETVPEFELKWNKSTTLKLVPKKNLIPGDAC